MQTAQWTEDSSMWSKGQGHVLDPAGIMHVNEKERLAANIDVTGVCIFTTPESDYPCADHDTRREILPAVEVTATRNISVSTLHTTRESPFHSRRTQRTHPLHPTCCPHAVQPSPTKWLRRCNHIGTASSKMPGWTSRMDSTLLFHSYPHPRGR
jgi:hypothetical protein